MKKNASFLILSLLLGYSLKSNAYNFQFDGYINTGATISDSSAKYLEHIDRTVEFSDNTNAGFRFSTKISDKLTATGLFFGKFKEKEDGLDVTLQNAFLRYQYSNNISLYAGRMYIPLWLISDYRTVGNLYPWTRPIPSVYELIAIETVNGVSFEYKKKIGQYYWRTKLLYGTTSASRSTSEYSDTSANTVRRDDQIDKVNLMNAVTEFYNKNFLIHAGYSQGVADARSEITSVGATSVQSTVIYLYPKIDYTFLSLGAKFNYKKFFMIAELAQLDLTTSRDDKDLSSETGYYLTVGGNFGKVSPHFTYAKYDGEGFSNPSIAVSNASMTVNESMIAGVNFDLGQRLLLKAEVEQVNNLKKTSQSSPSLFFNDINKLEDKVYIYGLTLSLMF